MPSDLRRTRPSDAPELVALAERCLGVGRDNPMFSPRHLQWKYWSGGDSDALPRAYVLERDGRIVAHAAVLPLSYRRGGGVLSLLHPFDWMSEPSAVGSGATLLKRLSTLTDGLVIVGGSDMTRRMVRPLGFREVGDVHCFTATASGPDLPPTCRVTELPELQRWEPTGADAPWLACARHPEWLRACLACPEAPMAVYGVQYRDAPIGGFVSCQAPAQGRIAAFWFDSALDADQALLVRAARAHAGAAPGVTEVVSMANEPRERRALVAAGFRAVRQVPMFVLARPPLDETERLPFQMLDGDVAFLHHGAPAPWVPDGSLPELTDGRP